MIYKIIFLSLFLLLSGCHSMQKIFYDNLYFFKHHDSRFAYQHYHIKKDVVNSQTYERYLPVANYVWQHDTGKRSIYYPSQFNQLNSNFGYKLNTKGRRIRKSTYTSSSKGGSSRGINQ